MHSPMKNQHSTSVVTTALMVASCSIQTGSENVSTVNRLGWITWGYMEELLRRGFFELG